MGRTVSGPYSDNFVQGWEGLTACRKPASFAVALYCGIGSSSLKALVKALATGKWSLLAVHNNVHNPFWSFDSKWVYFHGTDGDALWRVRVKDRRLELLGPEPVPTNYTACMADGFAPNGDVLLACFDRRSNIFTLQLK